MKPCYSFEERHYEHGLFNSSVDATYVIHLKDNGRLDNINRQLDDTPPTDLVYVVFNEGYKKCKKDDYIDEPAKDLTNAFLTVFRHAQSQEYNNILILEDDFLFTDKIKTDEHVSEINHFLNTSIDSDIQYSLGSIPWLRIPYIFNSNHYIHLVSNGMHAVIYTKSNREKILFEKEENIMDWDIYNFYSSICYAYHTPLCYQLVSETENSKNWGNQNVFTRIGGKVIFVIFKYFNMDVSVEPGYSYFYTFSKMLFFILLFILTILTIYLFKYAQSPIRYLSRRKYKPHTR
jgi:hypothetical protein